MIDIERWRAQSGLTQEQFGALMGLAQPQVSRLEANPESADVSQLIRMAKVFGVPIEVLLAGGPVAALNYQVDGDGWPGLQQLEGELRGAVAASVARWPKGDELSEFASDRISVVSALQRVTRRPRVVVCGPFDAGKSTLINGLLGTRAMPTRYQPTTSLVAHIRHVDTQPAWMDAPVWVLDSGFDPERWDEETHVRKHRIVSGGLDALREHGEHRDDGARTEAGYALVFSEAPILRYCELLDTPGDGHNIQDEQLTGSAEQFADVLIYLSPVTGFLGDRQSIDLMRRIRGSAGSAAGDLRNLFIVATHAAKVKIPDSDLAALLDRAAARLAMQMTAPEDIEGVPSWGLEAIRPRMFGLYDSNQNGDSRGQDFVDELIDLLGHVLPPQREAALRTAILKSFEQSLRELDSFGARMSESTSRQVPPSATDGDQFQTKLEEEVDEVFERLRADIDGRRRRCESEIDRIYDQVVNRDALRNIIDKNFNEAALKARGELASPKKAAQQDLPALVLNELAARVEAILVHEAREFGRVLDDELEDLQQAVQIIAAELGAAHIATDFTGAFVGAAMGGIAVGALALWASTLGNLGAYIIAAQAAGWLSAIGISLPAGGATLTAAMAAMGGPIGIAVAIIVVAALVGFTFRGPWEDRLAKNVVAAFAKPHKKTGATIKGALRQQAKQFWDDTLNAVHDGLHNVVKVHTQDVVKLGEIESATAQQRQAQLRIVHELRTWLQDLIFRIQAGRADA